MSYLNQAPEPHRGKMFGHAPECGDRTGIASE